MSVCVRLSPVCHQCVWCHAATAGYSSYVAIIVTVVMLTILHNHAALMFSDMWHCVAWADLRPGTTGRSMSRPLLVHWCSTSPRVSCHSRVILVFRKYWNGTSRFYWYICWSCEQILIWECYFSIYILALNKANEKSISTIMNRGVKTMTLFKHTWYSTIQNLKW